MLSLGSLPILIMSGGEVVTKRRGAVSACNTAHMHNLRGVEALNRYPTRTYSNFRPTAVHNPLLFQGSRHEAVGKLSLLSTEPVQQFWVIDELCMAGVLAAFGGAAEFLDDRTQSPQTRLQSLLVPQGLQ